MVTPPKRIKADGKLGAKIALIGEAGGKNENRILRPFVGWSGKMLDKWWRQVGLDRRRDFWIDNVYPFMPPLVRGYPVLGKVPKQELAEWTENLHDRLAELTDVNIIVPTGETALNALTGLSGIGRYRGSILSYNTLAHVKDGSHRPYGPKVIKVIPTYHPASLARRPINEKACIADWRKIAEESKTPEIILPSREYFTRPTLNDIIWYENQTILNSRVMAVDAEWTDEQVLCVGFSCSPEFSFTVPTTKEYWGSEKDLKKAWVCIQRILDRDIEKVLHHGHSDAYILKWFQGISIRNYKWDTLAMHHLIDPDSDHDLAYLASIYTRQPYWKDEAKDPEKIAKYATNFDALLTYNGLDCCVTRELFDVFYPIIVSTDRWEFYKEHYEELFEPMIEMMLHGINVDDRRRRLRHAAMQAEVIELQDSISEAIGAKCFAKKSLKGPTLMHYFYDTLKIPKQMRTRKKKGGEKVRTPTIDEVAIKRLMLKYPAAKDVGQLVLDHRRKYQLMTFYG